MIQFLKEIYGNTLAGCGETSGISSIRQKIEDELKISDTWEEIVYFRHIFPAFMSIIENVL